MPGARWIYAWAAEDEKFAQQYTRARESQVDKIQMDSWNGLKELDLSKVDPAIANASVTLARARADVSLRLAAQVAPAKYGRKVVDNNHEVGKGLAEKLDAAIQRKRQAEAKPDERQGSEDPEESSE